MKKKNETSVERVVYVKLSKYYINFLTTRYGSPVLFPTINPVNQCMERYLVNNPTLGRITPFSFSQQAFSYNENNPLFTADVYTPEQHERSEYLAIVMPDEIYRNGTLVKTSDTWQLSSVGAVQIRKQIKTEFWVAFAQMYDDCVYRAQRLGEKVTTENIATDFITLHNIEMSEYENMMRYWRRVRDQMNGEIENRREELETRTGNVFTYTA